MIQLIIMTPAEIARIKGGEVFEFTYANCDVADSLTLGAGFWGLYSADESLSVGDTITPNVGDDGVTTQAGSITFSVTLFHLDTFTSSHVSWEGSGITVEYTADGGGTWTALPDDAVVDGLDAGAEFDIRVNFAGGVAGELTSLTVYVFATETVTASKGRTASFTRDIIHDGTIILRGGELDVAADTRDPVTSVAAIEFWGKMDSGNGIVVQSEDFTATLADGLITATGCTVYVNGAVFHWEDYDPTANNHYVIVPAVPNSDSFTLGLIDMTVDHLALYESVPDIATLYQAQTGFVLRVNDTASFGVTESTPATSIYAYAWSVVSGGRA